MDEYLKAIANQVAQNNAWSAEQAQKQMDFQERMSNTSHVREIADLKAAGLNPVLSAKLGGASTPSGAMAETDFTGVNAMVGLMTKFLDIENENAKALQEVAKSYGSGYSSARSNYSSGVMNAEEGKEEGMSATDTSGILGLLGIRVPQSVADTVASFFNGLHGDTNGKNKSSKAYEVGYAIGESAREKGRGSLAQTQAYLFGVDNGKSTYDAARAAKELLSDMKDYAKNTVEYKADKYNQTYEKVKSAVSNVVNKVKSWFK